jgi:hypothetical protein
MSKERELLKKVIDFYRNTGSVSMDEFVEIIHESEELLAQPEQEPIAYAYDYLDSLYYATDKDVADYPRISRDGKPLYAAPPKPYPLTGWQN